MVVEAQIEPLCNPVEMNGPSQIEQEDTTLQLDDGRVEDKNDMISGLLIDSTLGKRWVHGKTSGPRGEGKGKMTGPR